MRAHPGSILEQAVQALDVQSQTHQIPLALDRVQAAHPELAKAQDALNPADGGFHQPFALGINFLTLGRVQFARHALGGRSPGAPLGRGMPLPAQGHITLNAPGFQLLQVPFIAVAGIGQHGGGGGAVVCPHGIQQPRQLALVTGLVTDRRGHNQLAVPVHPDLGVVALLEAVLAGPHDAALGVREVVLSLGAPA